MTLEDAAVMLEVSGATLSRIETGLRAPGARDIRDLLDAYAVTGEACLAEINALFAESRESGWWKAYAEVDNAYGTYIGREAASKEIERFEVTVIPAMFQTPQYLCAWLRKVVNPRRERPPSENDIEERIEVRLQGRRLLEPLAGRKYSVVIDEGVFVRAVRGADLTRRQIDHMVEAARLPNLRLRLMSFRSVAHPGQGAGRFTVLSLPHDVSDVVFVDLLVGGQLFLEDPAVLSRCRLVCSLDRRIDRRGPVARCLARRRLQV